MRRLGGKRCPTTGEVTLNAVYWGYYMDRPTDLQQCNTRSTGLLGRGTPISITKDHMVGRWSVGASTAGSSFERQQVRCAALSMPLRLI